MCSVVIQQLYTLLGALIMVSLLLVFKIPTKMEKLGHLGGLVVECLPSTQGVILESQDQVPYRAPHREPASPSAYVSASE